MKGIEEVVLNTFKVGEEYLRQENSMPANKIEEHALNYVNEIQKDLRDIQFNINVMKAELGKAGFEVEFLGKEVFPDLSEDNIHDCSIIHHRIDASELHSGGFLIPNKSEKFTICKVKKKNSDDVIVKTKAKVAEGDINIELLGEYLSLARATRIVLGDYNDN